MEAPFLSDSKIDDPSVAALNKDVTNPDQVSQTALIPVFVPSRNDQGGLCTVDDWRIQDWQSSQCIRIHHDGRISLERSAGRFARLGISCSTQAIVVFTFSMLDATTLGSSLPLLLLTVCSSYLSVVSVESLC